MAKLVEELITMGLVVVPLDVPMLLEIVLLVDWPELAVDDAPPLEDEEIDEEVEAEVLEVDVTVVVWLLVSRT